MAKKRSRSANLAHTRAILAAYYADSVGSSVLATPSVVVHVPPSLPSPAVPPPTSPEEHALRAELRQCQDTIDAAYWAFTRQARAKTGGVEPPQGDSMTAEEFTLPRDGKRPLSFAGTMILKEDGFHYVTDPLRYYIITVYKTTTGNYVLHLMYRTTWERELGHTVVETFATDQAMAQYLEMFDPCAWVVAFKPHIANHPEDSQAWRQYTNRQRVLEEAIRHAYHAQVSTVLTKLGTVEEV